MIRRIWDVIITIKNRDRIPPVPRMYATEYESLTIQERRILARMGARDPRGIAVAMRRYKVATHEELLALLEHHQPKRDVWRRVRLALGRMAGGGYRPHMEEIRRLRRRSRDPQAAEIKERLKRFAEGGESGPR